MSKLGRRPSRPKPPSKVSRRGEKPKLTTQQERDAMEGRRKKK